MIAELISGCYDVSGRRVSRLSRRLWHKFPSTYPFGRYLSQPLSRRFADLEELRLFLAGCLYVSDMQQFGRKDYWMPPEEFEEKRKGDCEDFALWTWRQLILMGYESRFVVGASGLYGVGHAWVIFSDEGKHFALELLAARIGPNFPRLYTLRYHPAVSVSWDGKRVRYYVHENWRGEPKLRELPSLLAEWVLIMLPVELKNIVRLPYRLLRLAGKSLKK